MASAIVGNTRTEQEPYGETAFRREVGRRIRTARIWSNLSQDQLAAKAGVSRNFVSAIERGTHGLDAWKLFRLARALDHDLGWLLDQHVHTQV